MPTEADTDLKKQLYEQCLAYVQNRLDTLYTAMASIQQATEDDTKSSAGDKYETSREMMQQDSTRNMQQLAEAKKLMAELKLIQGHQTTDTVTKGSLVFTDSGNFYISVSAGAIKLNDAVYFAVSAASPIGLLMMGKRVTDTFAHNQKAYSIKRIV